MNGDELGDMAPLVGATDDRKFVQRLGNEIRVVWESQLQHPSTGGNSFGGVMPTVPGWATAPQRVRGGDHLRVSVFHIIYPSHALVITLPSHNTMTVQATHAVQTLTSLLAQCHVQQGFHP